MKKFISVFLILALCFSLSAASFFEKAWQTCKEFVSDIEFVPASITPLYKGYKADVWSFDTTAQYFSLFGDGIKSILVQSRYETGMEDSYFNIDKVNGEYLEDYVFENAEISTKGTKNFLRLKPCLSVGLLRLSYGNFSLEGLFQAGLNMMLETGGSNDLYGYDGMYEFAVTASYRELVQLKFGLHHYSGHYADEILDTVNANYDVKGRKYADRFRYEKGKSDDEYVPGFIKKAAEYVRQDGMIFGLSVKPCTFVRLYGEADILPKSLNTLRPWILIPNNVDCSWANAPMMGRIGEQEKCMESSFGERAYKYSDAYKAMIFNLGAEFSYDFGKWGELTLAYNCRLNQEGQTMYQFNCYKEDNPWDIDHTLVIDYGIPQSPICLELMYHKGRIPLLNYFFYHGSSFGVGLAVHM